jgi:hypothetical protein
MSMSATALPVVAEKDEHAGNEATKIQADNSNNVVPLADKVDARQPDSKAFAVMKQRLEAAGQAPVSWNLKEHSSEQITLRTYRRKGTLRKVARKVLNILNAK